MCLYSKTNNVGWKLLSVIFKSGIIMGFREYFLKQASESEDDELTEQAIAGYGDWNPVKDRIFEKSLKQLKAEYDFVDNVKIGKNTLELYKEKTSNIFVLGVTTEDFFATVFNIELKPRKDVEHLFKDYKNIVNVDGVFVEKSMRGFGIAKTMYKYFVKNMHFTILGDEIQYHKARLTWASLSKMDDMLVDIINIDTGEIIQADVALHHGEADYEFDERVWDYAEIKKHVRLLLTKVE
jgi:hypothetical protein